MAANGSSARQDGPQANLLTPTSPARSASPSFTWLPPISRMSTINLVDSDSGSAPSPIENDSPRLPSGPAQPESSNGQWQSSSATSAAPQPAPHNSSPPYPRQQNSNPNLNSNPNGLVASGQPAPSQRSPAIQVLPHQMMIGRGGPVGQQVAPGQMMVNGQIFSMPGGHQWTAQESRLTEPLIHPNRNRSANNLRAYAAYDKETESEKPPPSQQRVNPDPPPSQPQPRPQNTSNPVPPTAPTRAFPRRGQNGASGLGDMSDDKSFRDTAARLDSVSPSSVASEDPEHKRGLNLRFGLGHQRSSSGATVTEQGPPGGSSEKKNIFSSVTAVGHSQTKPRLNSSLPALPTFNESDQAALQEAGDHGPGKKRLSELKGMIKGVGHAKEGGKDDTPTKIETIYEDRQPIEGSPPPPVSKPAVQRAAGQTNQFVPQAAPSSFVSSLRAGALRPRASMESQPSNTTTQPVAKGPSALKGMGRASTSDLRLDQAQQVRSEESGKKSSAVGFLGGLFNKQANKTKEIKPRPSYASLQSVQPPFQSGYQPFRPGQMSLPGQQLGPHPMLAGQPHAQRGQSPSPTLFQDLGQPLPSLQTAQAIPRRRPAEITVSPHSPPGRGLPSSQQYPNIPPSHLAQSTLNKYVGAGPYGQKPGQTEPRDDDSIMTSRRSLQLSDKSLDERATVEDSSTRSRIPPYRKPIGPSDVKVSGPFMTPALPPARADQNRPDGIPGEQRAPSQLSQYRQSPQLGFAGGYDLRRPSLPSPEPSPVPSQSDLSYSSRPPGDYIIRNSLDPRESEKGLGVYPNGLDFPGPTNASGLNGSLAPLSATGRAQSPYTPSSPTPSTDQGKLSKFFGAYDGGKPAAQSQANKEKSAASKFLSAFKRGVKLNETASSSESRPQTSSPTPQQGLRSPSPNTAAQGGTSGLTNDIPGSSRQSQWLVQAQAPKSGAPARQVQGGKGQVPGAAASKKLPEEPQYDQVPIPAGYEAVHGYGSGGMVDPWPYHAGHPGFPGVQYTQPPPYPLSLQPGYPLQQWNSNRIPFPQPGLMPGAAVPPQGSPNILYQAPTSHPQLQVQPPNPSSTAQNFPPQLQTELRPPLPRRFSPSPPAQRVPASQSWSDLSRITSQNVWNDRDPQSLPRAQGPGPVQAQTNAVWKSAPSKTPIPGSQPAAQPGPVARDPASNGTPSPPSHHIAAAAPVQAQFQANRASPEIQAGSPAKFHSSMDTSGSPRPARVRSPDAARLTSRMSVSRHGIKDMAVRPGIALQGEIDYGAVDNIQYAGSEKRVVNGADPAHAPGSIASTTTVATPDTSAGAGVGAMVVEDNMSFLDGSDDSEYDGQTESDKEEDGNRDHEREKEVAIHAEPEEKIPVDFPVELAAVHDDDDDDGIPMMSATSYPGQEWNPYGAGEFGDWE